VTDNVDLVRSIYAKWERGEFDSLGWAHAEIEFVVADGPEPTHTRGLRAMLQRWHGFTRAWSRCGIAGGEYHELDEHRVLVLIRGQSARLRGGTEAGAQIVDIRDGMVVGLTTYFARERALAELGLGEPLSRRGNRAER
jgi:hypothetical protein